MLGVIRRVLADRSGDVLEIGSGTGQHILRYASEFPLFTWWPSDPAPDHRASIEAWRKHAGPANLRAPTALDATDADVRVPAAKLTAVIAMNVIHIAPWAVCEGILALASRHLAADGLLFFYGPFRRDGAHTAPSNEAFDAMLRGQDPAWGVRDLGEVVAAAGGRGLGISEVVDMPANNLTVIFQRSVR